MTHELDPEGRPTPVELIDDRTLAALVRDVAEDWRMPPQRLDAPTWYDRVQRVRRGGFGHGWFTRLTGATTLAIVATVVLSLAAVWLTLPRAQVSTGKSPAPSGPVATPGVTLRPIPSPLPKLTLNGDLPSVTSTLLRVGGDFAIADLATGTLGQRIADADGNGDMLRLPDGRFVCLCIATDAVINGAYSHAVVSLRSYDPNGDLLDSRPIAEYRGVPDPRPGVVEDQPPHVDTAVSFSPDGKLGFVGWSLREPPVWKNGLVVVDLATGAVVKQLTLPDASTGPDNAAVNVFGAHVTFSPDGRRALVSRSSYSIDRRSQEYRGSTDLFRAASTGQSVDRSPVLPSTAQCPNGQADAGISSDGGVWVLCWSTGGGPIALRRIGPDGTNLGETTFEGFGEDGVWAPTRDGTGLYLWSPLVRMISRVDLRTGEKTAAAALAPSGSTGSDPLNAFGRWLAPAVVAKVFLDPGLALSPDGSRLYALGVARGPTEFFGSAGIDVLDATTLAPLGHWAPEADYVSIALSQDGRFVYAVGAPGVDAAGQQSAFGASITVYDAADGSIRLQAGQLEHDDLRFLGPILP